MAPPFKPVLYISRASLKAQSIQLQSFPACGSLSSIPPPSSPVFWQSPVHLGKHSAPSRCLPVASWPSFPPIADACRQQPLYVMKTATLTCFLVVVLALAHTYSARDIKEGSAMQSRLGGRCLLSAASLRHVRCVASPSSRAAINPCTLEICFHSQEAFASSTMFCLQTCKME